MKVLLTWIKDYIDIDETPQAIADALNMAGIEVEEIIEPGKNLSKIVAGEILTCEPHPNADKLTLCSVSVGNTEPLKIVCGATNMKPGDKVPVALLGAKLPAGFEISKAKIRGVESYGMLCSKSELGLSNDHEGLCILPENATPGEDIVKTLKLDEVIFDVSITPNRGDTLSHLGIARELSAIFNLPMHREPLSDDNGDDDINDYIQIEINEPELCPRYGSRIVKNVQLGASPEWMQERLSLAGVKPINNVVDITNYIMLDIGQPMHAFDYDLIEGKKIIVRRAEKNEKIKALDESNNSLDSSMLVIADSNKPVAIAGVMGGLHSAVTEKTKNVLLEAAAFNSISVRKTAKKLAMASESSYRFERGTNIDNVPIALNEAVKYLKKYASGNPVKLINDCYPKPIVLKQVRLRTKRLNKMLGINLSTAQIETYLLRLKLEVRRDGEDLITSVPPYRHDIEIEADLIEEVARMYGYNNIPETLPSITSVLKMPDNLQRMVSRLNNHMVSLGFSQIMSYSFIPSNIDESFKDKTPLRLKNPISEDLSCMRTNLKWNMYDALKRNILNDEYNLKFFEIGKVFHPDSAGFSNEFTRLCIGVSGAFNPSNWQQSSKTADLFMMKGIAESVGKLFNIKLRFNESSFTLFHPSEQIEVLIGKEYAGVTGKIHPRLLDNKKIPKSIYLLELNLDMLANSKGAEPKMQPTGTYPPVKRDLALLVPSKIAHRDIIKVIKNKSSNLLEDCYLFDIYEGKNIEQGFRSMAYSLTFRSQDKTLTDEEIQPSIENIVSALNEQLNIRLR